MSSKRRKTSKRHEPQGNQQKQPSSHDSELNRSNLNVPDENGEEFMISQDKVEAKDWSKTIAARNWSKLIGARNKDFEKNRKETLESPPNRQAAENTYGERLMTRITRAVLGIVCSVCVFIGGFLPFAYLPLGFFISPSYTPSSPLFDPSWDRPTPITEYAFIQARNGLTIYAFIILLAGWFVMMGSIYELIEGREPRLAQLWLKGGAIVGIVSLVVGGCMLISLTADLPIGFGYGLQFISFGVAAFLGNTNEWR